MDRTFRVGTFSRLFVVGCPYFIPGPSGRQRFDVLGALNAITHEMITFTNDTYITSQNGCVPLENIVALYIDIPITMFLDNALNERCALVIEKARSLNIELCFLPSYSPNLNLIERVWKFMKKKCLYSHYYEKFPAFKEATSKCLEGTMSTHKSDLDSLLALRFQTFQKA